MQLNIYNISHPIIKILSSLTRQEKENIILSSYYHKQIGLLLIYEVLRKHITIHEIYIKSLYSTKLFNVISKEKKYIIFTNLRDNYNMVSEIQMLISNIKIIDISYNNRTGKDKDIYKIINSAKYLEIFILMRELRTIKIIDIIQEIKLQNNISTDNIQIISIIAYQDILTRLSYHYPQLKIYTTKITCD